MVVPAIIAGVGAAASLGGSIMGALGDKDEEQEEPMVFGGPRVRSYQPPPEPATMPSMPGMTIAPPSMPGGTQEVAGTAPTNLSDAMAAYQARFGRR